MLYLKEHCRVTPLSVSISAVDWLNVYGSLHRNRKSQRKQLKVYVLPSPLLCHPYYAARSLRVMYKSTVKTAVFLFHKHKKMLWVIWGPKSSFAEDPGPLELLHHVNISKSTVSPTSRSSSPIQCCLVLLDCLTMKTALHSFHTLVTIFQSMQRNTSEDTNLKK